MAQVPSKVTLSRANTPTADGFTVAWSDLSNETAYHLEHTTSANFTTSTLITNISANATSHALTGLTPGTTYYVRVRGVAAGGNGTWSDVQANQLLSIDPGQTRYLSGAGVPHGASHSVNFTISDIFGSANSAGLAAGTTASEASTILLLGSDGSTAHTVFYNSSQNQWREGDTNKGSEIVGFGKGFMVKNNTGSADIFLLSGSIPVLDTNSVTVFPAGAPAGRLSLLTPSKTTATSLRSLGLTNSNNTTTGLKRATTAKDADLLLIPDNAGGLRRYHFDGTNWRSGLRTVSDPNSVTVPAGGAFFLRKAAGSSFEQWRPPSEIVTDGLILHLDASNPDSYPGNGTTWTDLSGNGNNGTLTNGPTFNSANGGAISFDGTNDYVTLGTFSSINNVSQLTINSWFFANTLTAGVNGWSPIFSKRNSDTQFRPAIEMVFGDSDGGFVPSQIFIRINTSTDSYGSSPVGTIRTTGWYNTTVVYDGSGATNSDKVKLYVQGKPVSLTFGGTIPSTTSNPAGHARIGGMLFTGQPRYFNGRFSVTQVYNRALSPQEVLTNYHALKRRHEDPDATTYLNAVEAADGQALEPDVREAVDNFVKGCKADGIWSDLKASCILFGARTLDGALTPLVGSAPTKTGFVSGDYNRKNGLIGGSGRSLNSNRSNNVDPQNDFHMSVYVHTVGTANFGYYLGTQSNSSGADQILRNNATLLFYRCRNGTSRSPENSNVTGLIGVNRSSSGSYTAYYGGSTTVYNDTSQTPLNQNIFVFNNQATASFPTNGRLQFYSIGEATNLALLEGRLSTLVADIAAAIP